MKSIRLSLVFYFLALLALALGVASWMLYQIAHQTLLAKKESTERLVESQYKYRCAEEEKRLNTALLYQAQTLARLVSVHLDWHRGRSLAVMMAPLNEWARLHRETDGGPRVANELHLLGMLTAGPTPGGGLLAMGWALEASPEVLNPERFKGREEIKFDPMDLASSLDEQIAEYYQIDTSWGSSYRSQSLKTATLPVDTSTLFPDDVVGLDFNDCTLSNGVHVHRVILKASGPRMVQVHRGPEGPRPDGARFPPPPNTPSPGTRPRARPGVFIQCAYLSSKLTDAFERWKNEERVQLARLDAENDRSLSDLRNRLLAISSLTFVASVLGAFLLIWRGLSPLRRLTDAVSRVSPRDFRLPLNPDRLPKELRPIAARLTQTLEMLKAAFAREKQATADISHELRTPLAALLTTLEIALKKPRTAGEYREFLEDCQLSGKQLNQAVERLLTLARLDAGVEMLRPRDVDVGELAAQCAAVVKPLAEARGLSLSVKREGRAHLTADPDKLREVINNLLHNSIQYNKPSGAVELRVVRNNRHLEVAVSDTGIGIADEAKPHIFERFYRADRARSDDGLHAGLGLAIVKEYVELMGGNILVESAEGQGTTFRVRLPALAGDE